MISILQIKCEKRMQWEREREKNAMLDYFVKSVRTNGMGEVLNGKRFFLRKGSFPDLNFLFWTKSGSLLFLPSNFVAEYFFKTIWSHVADDATRE